MSDLQRIVPIKWDGVVGDVIFGGSAGEDRVVCTGQYWGAQRAKRSQLSCLAHGMCG